MSRRKLTDQQKRRIAQRRSTPQSSATHATGLEPPQLGLITAHFGRQVEVEGLEAPWQGIRQTCHQRANLGSLVTGDQVIWCPSALDHQPGVIESVQPRRSLLARPDTRGKMKAIAANIDQLFLVLAPEPEAHSLLIDRYLVAAELAGITPVLLLNKADLFKTLPEASERLKQLTQRYVQLGYPLMHTSHLQPDSLEALSAQLKDRISVFVGQSGVGKSSLINHWLPDIDLAVGALSEETRKGRHTTTTARLFHFPLGGQLIDSPGIRDFSLEHLSDADIALGFREFHPYLGHCRFRDCRHDQEPGCALREAVKSGAIDPARFESFRHLTQQLTP